MKKIISLVMVIAMIAALGITASAADITKDGLIVGFDFDGDNKGVTATNATGDAELVISDEGHSGKALDLSTAAEKGWVSLTKADNTGIFDGVDGSVTISFWSKNDAAGVAYWGFFACPNDVTEQAFQQERYIGMLENGGTLTTEFYDNAGARPANALADGYLSQFADQWKMVTFVINTETKTTTAYVNGDYTGEGVIPDERSISTILGDDYSVWLGHANWGANGENGGGLIDDLCIFNYAMNDEQVKSLAVAQGLPAEPVETGDNTQAPDDGTQAPDDGTQAPADDGTQAPAASTGDGTTATDDKGGCGSTLGAAAAIVALTAVFGCAVVKKH